MAKRKKKPSDDGIPEMTDNMKKALDQGKDLPIEQLVSGGGMEHLEAMRRARTAPVRADALRPISKTEANLRNTFSGTSLPGVPSTRRVVPAPFQRETISIRVPGEPRREWHMLRADQVQSGDTVPGIGLVVQASVLTRYETVAGVKGVATGTEIVLVGAGGNSAVYDAGDQVQVFTLSPAM